MIYEARKASSQLNRSSLTGNVPSKEPEDVEDVAAADESHTMDAAGLRRLIANYRLICQASAMIECADASPEAIRSAASLVDGGAGAPTQETDI